MDKSLMSQKRNTWEYIDGVEGFFELANKKLGKDNLKPCPCLQCLNLFERSNSEIRFHLYSIGIDLTYTQWTSHGESKFIDGSDNDYLHEGGHHFDTDEPDDFMVTKEMIEAAQEQYFGDPNKFHELLHDADKPLYEGCTKHTMLSAVVKIFNVKAKSGWSDISFSRNLKLVGDLLPDGNLLPKSMDGVKKILALYGMKYQKIHACPKDCILYRDIYENESSCPKCGLSRYKEHKNKSEKSRNIPAKLVWYFPPIPRFERMFQSEETAKNLTWHSTERVVDDKLRHPADSPAWKLVDFKWPQFGAEARNLRLALSTDGINPHGSMSSKYSCWPVLLITYNLPPWLCMKRKYMLLTILISGPRQPRNDIDVYLRLIINDLKLLWAKGVEVYDAYQKRSFTLKAVLLWTISDFPALSNLSGHTVKGYYACPVCSKNTNSERLNHSKKNAYRGSRRWLERDHPYRKQKKAFNGKQENRPAPIPLKGEEILQEIANIVNTFGKKGNIRMSTTTKRFQRRSKAKHDCSTSLKTSDMPLNEDNIDDASLLRCWKKKSIFFELEYWKHLLVRHNLDVMHIEKNVCESIIGTLLNIPGKTKDGLNSLLDLQDMGLRMELTPEIRNGRPYLPPACYTLSRLEKTRLCQILHDLKVPEGYSSNFRRLVSMEDLKLHGLKSHDCHVLMQQLLPVALRSILPKHVRHAVIRFCYFFNGICAKVVDVPKLLKLQKDLVVTLCLLEKYFPPSFFDIMVHLTVHLVREVLYCGPVFLRWMYAFERDMAVLKGYVRNRNRPEGCIAESYVAEEAIEFMSEFFPDLDAVGNLPGRDINYEDMALYESLPPGGRLVRADRTYLRQAHLYVLQNTNDVEPYIGLHIDHLKKKPGLSKRPTKIQEEHIRSFADWLQNKVFEERCQSSNNISKSLRWIAQGPNPQAMQYESYIINDFYFSTIKRDASRVNQNSGVSLVANTIHVSSAKDKNPVFGKMSYYGVIAEIWLLDYSEFHIPMFKCDWVDNNSGVKTDDLGFTLVDRSRVGFENEPFILASQAEQVFYVDDKFDPKWSVVLVAPQRCYLNGEKDNDLYDGNMEENANPDSLPSVESFDPIGESRTTYMREDVAGSWINE